MPYTVRKQKCKRSDGGSGSYVLSYTDKKGKKHRNCHRSKKSARAQIGAIEMEESVIRELISQIIGETLGNSAGGFEGTEDGNEDY
jgi:hypothetical protein